MRRPVAVALCVVLLMLFPCACVAEEFMPGPTPRPDPRREGGVPAYIGHVESEPVPGVPYPMWVKRFIEHCVLDGVPLSDGGFELTSDRKEIHMRFYRVLAGGSELFVQVHDETTVVQVVLYLDDESMTTRLAEETALYYFEKVVRACLYASEPGIPSERLDTLTKGLMPDLSAAVRHHTRLQSTIRTNTASHSLSCEPLSFWETITFSTDWSES